MVQLRRDNSEDPRLLRDLAFLAGEAERPGDVALSSDDVVGGSENDAPREPSVLDDPFVNRFVRITTHVRRYAGFYAGGVAWALAVLLIQPIGGRGGLGQLATAEPRRTASVAFLSPTGSTAVDAPPGVTVPLLYDDTFGGTAFTSSAIAQPFDVAGPTFPESADGDDREFLATDTGAGSSSDEGTPPFTDVADEFSSSASSGPQPLFISQSGYASATGETPLEQAPPENGLPVSAAGGQRAKVSFIALQGDQSLLRLRPVSASGANVNPERAGVRACRILAPWPAVRGQALSKAPAYSSTECVTGLRLPGGDWTFDLGDFGSPSALPGLALVPVPDPTLEFIITFRPVAERPEA